MTYVFVSRVLVVGQGRDGIFGVKEPRRTPSTLAVTTLSARIERSAWR